jgi:tripartite-type tricarboxylate transporter receptor subunit TctC
MQKALRRAMVLAGLAAVLPLWGHAQGLSSRPVRIIVAQTPGTTADILARAMAARFAERWGQPFVVENRPGASARIGMSEVASAPPDGHTLIVNVSSTLALPAFYKELPFDVLKSFQPLGYIGSNNMALAVNSAVPAKNIAEYIAWVKAQPKPVHYATPGNGTHHHLFMELLKLSARLDMVHVPFKGLAGANTALLSGEIPTMFTSIHTAMGWVRDGKVRLLGGTMKERHPMFAELPSLHEQGVDGFDAHSWYALWGPAGMPEAVVRRYNQTLGEVLRLPELSETFLKQGISIKPGSPADLAKMAEVERDTWARVVRAANIKPD